MVQAVEGLRRWDRTLVELSALSQVYRWHRQGRLAVEDAQVAQAMVAESRAAMEEEVARARAKAEARRVRKKRARERKRDMAQATGGEGAETTELEFRDAVAGEAGDWEPVHGYPAPFPSHQ